MAATKLSIELTQRNIDLDDITKFNQFMTQHFAWYLKNAHAILGQEHPVPVTHLHLCIGTYPDVDLRRGPDEPEPIPTDYFEHHYIQWARANDACASDGVTMMIFFDKNYGKMSVKALSNPLLKNLVPDEPTLTKSTRSLANGKFIRSRVNDQIYYLEHLRLIVVICPFYLPTSYPSKEDASKQDIPKTAGETPLRYTLTCDLTGQVTGDPVVTGWATLLSCLSDYLQDKKHPKLYIFNDALTYEAQAHIVHNRYLAYFCELGFILHKLSENGWGTQVAINIPNMLGKFKWPRTINYHTLNTIVDMF
jgi:hypothetical protein